MRPAWPTSTSLWHTALGCDGRTALQLIWPMLFRHLKASSVGLRALWGSNSSGINLPVALLSSRFACAIALCLALAGIITDPTTLGSDHCHCHKLGCRSL